MKVSAINFTNANSLNNTKQNPYNRHISFGSIFDTLDISPYPSDRLDLSALLKRHDEITKEIKEAQGDYKIRVLPFGIQAAEIQQQAPAKGIGKTIFEHLESIKQNEIEPLRETLSSLDKDSPTKRQIETTISSLEQKYDLEPVYSMYKTVDDFIGNMNLGRQLYDNDFNNPKNIIIFKSKDKELAQEVASFYSSFKKASFNISEYIHNPRKFFEMLIGAFNFEQASTTLQIKEGEGYSQQLRQVLQEFSYDNGITNRTTFLTLNDFEKMFDKGLCTRQDIHATNGLMERSFKDFRTVIMAPVENLDSANIDKHILRRVMGTIDLDELGVTKDKFNIVKGAQAQLQGQISGIETIFRQIPPRVFDSIIKTEQNFTELEDTLLAIKKYGFGNLLGGYEENVAHELKALAQNDDSYVSFIKQKDYISRLAPEFKKTYYPEKIPALTTQNQSALYSFIKKYKTPIAASIGAVVGVMCTLSYFKSKTPDND